MLKQMLLSKIKIKLQMNFSASLPLIIMNNKKISLIKEDKLEILKCIRRNLLIFYHRIMILMQVKSIVTFIIFKTIRPI